MNDSENLTDREIDDICDGLTQSAAKIKFLRTLGLLVKTKPNGRPLVGRSHYRHVMGAPIDGLPDPVADNMIALRVRRRHGQNS